LRDVEVEIAEHRQMENWNKHCQVKVLQDHGINSCIGYNYLFIFAAEPDALSEYRTVL